VPWESGIFDTAPDDTVTEALCFAAWFLLLLLNDDEEEEEEEGLLTLRCEEDWAVA
jgi:hypothetical protein